MKLDFLLGGGLISGSGLNGDEGLGDKGVWGVSGEAGVTDDALDELGVVVPDIGSRGTALNPSRG